MKLVLIGFMGSGKSLVGRLLAARLGWKHHDTDALVAAETGMPVPELIRAKGEAVFRAAEGQAVSRVGAMDRAVISTGGGVPLDPANMERLRSGGGIVVWLRLGPEAALQRIQDLASRPLIDPEHPLEAIRRLMAAREPCYACADHVIDVDDLSPPEVVDRILSAMSMP